MKIKALKKSLLTVMALAGVLSFVSAKPVCAAPAKPASVEQTASTETGFKVEWAAVTGATSYNVSVYSLDGKTKVVENQSVQAKEYVLNDTAGKLLTSGTAYQVQVSAVDASGAGEAAAIAVATAPKAMTSFEQIGATSTTVKLTWGASPSKVSGYLIKMGADAASAKDITPVTTTTVNLTGLTPDTSYYVAVYPFIKVTDKFYATEKCVYSNRVMTTAKDYNGLKIAEWDVRRDFIRFSWKASAVKNESGYQVQLLKSNGKVYKTEDIRGRNINSVAFFIKKLKNKGFSFRMRSYNLFNGEKSYGEWSDTIYCVPQAILTAKKGSDTTVNLSWGKITGAKDYSIYQATTDGGNYSKIATTSGTNYTLSNLTAGADYYYYVSANKVKVSKKKKASSKLEVPNDVHVALYPTKKEVEVR